MIDSSKELKPEEHDLAYRSELEKMTKLKSLVIAHLPDMYSSVIDIEGNYNNYWGNQRILLHVDIKDKPDDFRAMQRKVIEIANKTTENIHLVIRSLQQLSIRINNEYSSDSSYS